LWSHPGHGRLYWRTWFWRGNRSTFCRTSWNSLRSNLRIGTITVHLAIHSFVLSLLENTTDPFSQIYTFTLNGALWCALTLIFGMTCEILLETPKIERDCFDRILHFNSRRSLKIHCKSARHAFVSPPFLLLCLLREYISWLKNRLGISKSMNVRILKSLKTPWIYQTSDILKSRSLLSNIRIFTI